MLALAYYRRGVCACGFHESLTGDKANHFTFETKVCPVCRAEAKMDRIQEAADKQSDKSLGENPSPMMSRAADGRRRWIRPLHPLEVAMKEAEPSGPRGL